MIFTKAQEGTRSYGPDNLKFLLIFFVVLGHLIELSPFSRSSELMYLVIYTFHMPVFIFLAGYFAKYSKRRIIFQIAYAYILFQVLYLVFDYYVLQDNPGTGLILDFAFPYWILWYLMVLLLFNLLIPLIDLNGTKERGILLLGCFALSLLSGFDIGIGNYISLSRFFFFLPFFVMGFYWKKSEKENGRVMAFSAMKPYLVKALSTVAVFLSIYYVIADERITRITLYGSLPYSVAGYDVGLKLIITAIAVIWVAFFFIVILPLVNRKIPLISTIGRNSFSIFLLHGFVIKLMEKHGTISDANRCSMLWILIGTSVMLILFGNPVTAKVFNALFTGNWIYRLLKKMPSKAGKSNSPETSS